MKKSFTIFAIAVFAFLSSGSMMASGGSGGTNSSKTKKSSGLTTQINSPGLPVNPLALIYHDDFNGANDTTSLKARGYHVYYRGTGPQGVAATWFQGNPTVFNAYNGPDSGYVAANYQVVTNVNTIDSWLVLPALNLTGGDTISFYSQAPLNSGFPDSIRVMYSAAGDTLPEATSWVELGRFKVNTLGMWEYKEFVTATGGTNARFAIRYRVAGGGPNGNNSDYIGIDELMVRGPVQVVCPVTTVPTVTSGSNCGAGSVQLSATTGGANTYVVWLDDNGNVVGSGNTFDTPNINATTTYYAADADTVGQSVNVGPDTSIATGAFPTSNFTNGLFFTAMTDIRIDSIHLYSNGPVSGVIQISDTVGSAIHTSAPFSLPGAGYHQVYVGLNVSAGDYFMNMGSLSGTGILFRTTSGATYPYTAPGVVSITGANFADPTRYYYFFEWTVTPVCFGTQVPVVATILPANNTLPFYEDFENGLPCNWSTQQLPGSFGWLWGDDTSLSSTNWTIPPHTNFMASNDDSCNCTMSLDLLITPVFDFSSYNALTNITLNFEAYYDSSWGSTAHVLVSLDSGVTWNNIYTLTPSTSWQNVIVDLSPYAGSPAVQLAFHHDDLGEWADGFAVDDVLITATCTGDELTFNLVTDIYGTEITWSIVDVNSGVIYGSGGPYEDLAPYSIAAATHNVSVCVPSGATLEFQIEDIFGDGLTDGTNTGFYNLYGPCGELITSGTGAFTSGGSTANPPSWDSLVFTIQPPVISLPADTIMCEGTTLTLDAGIPNVTWSTGETTTSIVVNNDTPGTYTYYVSTPAGNCFATDTIQITVNPLPVPDFSATVNNGVVTFTNTSANATSYHWNFGTGNPADTSNAMNPTFTYTADGTYTVVLTAYNACGSVSHTFDVVVVIIGIEEIPGVSILLTPNPASSSMMININGLSGESITMSIINVLGQTVFSERISIGGDVFTKEVDVNSFEKGVYFVTLRTDNHATTKKLIVE